MKSPSRSSDDAVPSAALKSSPPLTPAQSEFARVLGDILAAAWDAEPRNPAPAPVLDGKSAAKKLSRRSKRP